MPPVCIVHTISDLQYRSAGPSYTTPALCEALGSLGASVHVMSQVKDRPGKNYFMPNPKYVQTHLLPLAKYSEHLNILYSPSFRKTLRNLCYQEKIDIIHDHSMWTPSNHLTAKISRQMHIPLVVQPRGSLEPWALAHKALKKRIAWAIYVYRDLQTASLFVATSYQEASAIRGSRLHQPIAVIPNGVELPPIAAPKVKHGQHNMLFLSRIHPKKGLLNLVSAWAQVRPDGWRAIVAGPDDGNHLPKVKQAVKKAKLERDFDFVGEVVDSARETLYRNADLFVLPTFSENFGVVVAEALSYGLPVITTTGAPWGELLTNHCGWWVDPAVAPIANAIRQATSLSDAERYEMGQRGRRYVQRTFSWGEIGMKMIATYNWILNKTPPIPDWILID